MNFALFFSVWDRRLGTALHLPGYALADDDLGIGDRPDYPDDYLAQLCEPFRHQAGGTAAVVPEALRRALGEQAYAQVAELPIGADTEGGPHGT
ncbi:MAG: hypothetical protein GAK45_01760 [Pseudomonas citronellolis]|nr:MAG: hypothetical protein GAK45_01760 [Pseudomonas citronellolis]